MTPAAGRAVKLTRRQKADKLRTSLKQEYDNGWRGHHRDISDYIQPRRARFLTTDQQNSGGQKNDLINNNVATIASDTLRAGLTSGTASAARPWFRLTTHDPTLGEVPAVKEWLYESERIAQGIIAKSNFYLRIEELYGDLGDFGTAVLHIEADEKEVIRCYVFPVGSYYLAQSARGVVDTVFRDIPMTVKQLVEKFGYEKCCLQVRTAWDNGNIYQYFEVVHFIAPNEDYQEGMLGPRGKQWSSIWYEQARQDEEGFLAEGGYDYFPCMAPRWKVTGNNVWGDSPGMTALPDVRGLQHLEEQAMGVVDKTVNPPLNIPSSMRGQQASLLPGAENYVAGTGQKIEPVMLVHPQALVQAEEKIRQSENRIRAAYHADLFRLLEQFKNGEMTAYEVQQRIQEKMQLIGPAYERTEEELLDPAIEAILHILFEGFYLPPVPDELAGMEIKVEYTSIIAQAQKAAGTGILRELLQVVGNLVAVAPEVIDNIDLDKMIHAYADMLGIPPKLMRTPEAVALIRAEKQKMLAAQQKMQVAGQMAAGAKVLSETNTEGKNALTDILARTGRV